MLIVTLPPVYFIPVGLTSSLDSLLSTTTQAQLPERSPIPMKDTVDAEPIQPAVGQRTAPADSTASGATLSDFQVSKDDSPHTSDSTHHYKSVDKSTSTAPCDSEASSQGLDKRKLSTLSTDMTTKDIASAVDSSEPAYKAMIHAHDKLVTAISTDTITISGVLLAKEFIPSEISNKMLLPFTEREKATILVNAITDKINIAPKRFDELVKIISEQTCTKDIVNSLLSQVRPEQDDEGDTQDGDTEATKSSRQYAVCEPYTAWASLNPADKIDLEARLIDDAEAIRVEFALLCWRARDSFEERDIKPRTLASALLDLKINDDLSNGNDGTCIPLLKEKEGALMSAKSVHDTFDIVRPHMNFFNYEILQFLIQGKGSKEDKIALSKFLRKFE